MERDLTKDKIASSLILFSIPMILGNLLQQLYNIVDTYIVGKFVGNGAIGAVGSSYTLMTFLTSIIIGLCMGSGILFSMYFGARKENQMKVSFFVSFISIGLLSLVLELLCFILLPFILNWLQIPQSIYHDTYLYLKIIFVGIIFTFIYNYFAALLRALGNSKTPLLFLALSTISNIVLDLVFVLVLKKGVAGAAIATVISQVLSALGIMLYVFFFKRKILPGKEHFHFDLEIFKKLKDYSLMTCLQQGIMNFGILMIQGLVNSFGLDVMSAFSVAVKIDSFAYMPVQDFGNAFSTFVAQNQGAKQETRIKQGLYVASLLSFVFCVFISLGVCLFSYQLMALFVSGNSHIIQIGMTYLRIEGSCYIGIGCLFLLYGYYRGVGKMKMSLILTVISLGTRVGLSYIFAPIWGKEVIWISIVIGWILADLVGIVYGIKKENWRHVNGVND
ncbi:MULTISPECIES: MATE family efflux transporter [Coprobacillaceae]|uniref:MATE family efflux transporter n=1 Tax=Coprobacillaceae TaxID=2810280 RepID=UPI000E46A7E4|nr:MULTISPECIES: MATE family efflux transporter [Coprobacillaceae]RHM62888.1 MATE family efflux transporter [Coprobacillus sp. AF33-1AC]RHS94971.1 MATE family efflux transporter [Erysipelatoclostridium sp. AM42-17]